MEQALIEQVKQLLQSTGSIIEKHEEIARLKGENFNVFRLLGIEDKEVKLHSPFIAELLDPKGSHDQKTAFLKMFLEQVVKPLTSDSLPEESKTKVHKEYYIGPKHIDGKNSTGGRIDIFITDGTRHISIENKIKEGEREDYQIIRYCNHDTDRNLVLFLTPCGVKASTDKACPISYKKHILPWLKSCQKHCADLPILRETIKQYIITIKGLTGGLTMQKMEKTIQKLIMKNIEAAHEIYSNYEPTFKETVKKFVQEVKEEIESKEPFSSSPKDWKLEIYHKKDRTNKTGIEIKNIQWEWEDLRTLSNKDALPFMIEWQDIYKQSYYGIVAHRDHYDWDKIKKKLDGIKIEEYDNDCWWPFRTNSIDFQNLNDLKELWNPEERSKLAKDVALKLVELMDFCDKKLLPPENRNS